MTLSSKNIFVRYYKHTKKHYPNDFCGLFWYSLRHAIMYLFILAITVSNFYRLGWWYLLYLLGGIALAFGMIALVVWIKDKRSSYKEKPVRIQRPSKFRENVITFWGAIRNKYCTKITVID